jgi:hypothetical protein
MVADRSAAERKFNPMPPIIDPSERDDVNCSDVVEPHTYDDGRTVPGISTVEPSTELISDGQAPLPTQRSPLSLLTTTALVDQCRFDINRSYLGEHQGDSHGLELLRRATLDHDQDAWQALQQCLRQTLLRWLDRHPAREAACHLKTEAYYVNQSFERFSQVTMQQQLACCSWADALLALCLCLNSAILDALRASSPSDEILTPRKLEAAESHAKGSKQSDVWELLGTLLPDAREQRLAFLLFHCGLRPKEIVLTYPHEFPDLEEISRLRCRLMQQVLDHVDRLD